MTAIAIGHSQCRQPGGGGGADGLGLSPGGGGVACLLICGLTHVQLLVLPSMPGAGGAPAIGLAGLGGQAWLASAIVFPSFRRAQASQANHEDRVLS